MWFWNKLLNAFWYSHPWNKKTIQSNLEKFIELLRYNTDILLKIISDFRTAHMNIIAWMIAFLWFINKDWIQNDIHFKYWVIALLIFIASSIVVILMSFYYDTYSIKSNMNYLSKYVKISKQHKDEILKFDFDKDKAEDMNKKLSEFKAPTYPIIWFIVNILYFITWLILIYGLYNIIMYYIWMI